MVTVPSREAWTVCGKMSAELAMQMYIEELKQVGAAEPVDGGGRGLNCREGVSFRSGWGGAWMTISKPGGVRRGWSMGDLFKAERGCPSG